MNPLYKDFFDATKDIANVIISGFTLWIGYLIYTKGIVEYRNGNQIKRAEFLEKLIEDFRKKEMSLAKNMLDDFTVYNKSSAGLPRILRDHKGENNLVTEQAELDIRASFDDLFDFFTKLAYYRKNNLISADELGYFHYYIDKIKVEDFESKCDDPKKEGARLYIRSYFNRKDFEFLFLSVR